MMTSNFTWQFPKHLQYLNTKLLQVASGKIKASRVGKKLIRIHKSELDRYVESTTINPDG